MSHFIVYSITCRFNGMVYIGRTKDETRRQAYHFGHLRNGTHINTHLQRAFDKHGASQFFWRVIGRYESDAEVRKHEQFFIDHLWDRQCLYNLVKSADGGGVIGHRHSKEARERMSASRRIYLSDPAVRANLSAKHMGKTLSPEHRAKLSAAKKGRAIAPEQRAAMVAGIKAAWARRKVPA